MKEIKITDIEGIKIGNAENKISGTGCTVIICEKGGVAGVDVRGGGPASHETELLNPINTVDRVHGICLSGGSAFGLEATAGVMKYLEEKEIGFKVGDITVPIVCGASLFDLAVGDSKIRPDKEMGYLASQNSEKNIVCEGNFGAGTGASVGKYRGMERAMKSGLGTYAVQVGDLKVGAIVAVNAVGDVIDIENNKPLAGILNEEKTKILSTREEIWEDFEKTGGKFTGNTTIACLVTNGNFTKAQATKIAGMTHNGFARAICPVHTSLDGDTIFVLGTGEIETNVDTIGTLGAYVMAKAINRAVKETEEAYGLISLKDLEK